MDDPRIQPYLEHLKREEGYPPFTGAEKILRSLYCEHGVGAIDSLLREHWDAVRTAGPIHLA